MEPKPARPDLTPPVVCEYVLMNVCVHGRCTVAKAPEMVIVTQMSVCSVDGAASKEPELVSLEVASARGTTPSAMAAAKKKGRTKFMLLIAMVT